MAKQLITTVVSVNGNPQKTPFDKSFSTDAILVAENTDENIDGESYILSNGVQYFTEDEVADLLEAANDGSTSMIEASVVNIDGYPVYPTLTVLFPASDAVTIEEVSDDDVVNSAITFLGKKY